MKRWLSALGCVGLFLLLLACVKSPVVIDRVYVKNATNDRITDVEVRHEPIERSGSVNTILPHKSLDIGFAALPLQAQKASVGWRDSSGREWRYLVDLPDGHDVGKKGRPMSLVYIIYPEGLINVHFLESVKIK